MGFIDNFKVAHETVKQLNRGEWEFKWNSICGDRLTAKRNGVELWVGSNGGWFVDSYPKLNLFGYFWRHYVYIAGVAPIKAKLKNQDKLNKAVKKAEMVNKWIK